MRSVYIRGNLERDFHTNIALEVDVILNGDQSYTCLPPLGGRKIAVSECLYYEITIKISDAACRRNATLAPRGLILC